MTEFAILNSMEKVVVLVAGYAHPNKNGEYIASCSSTLIYSNGKKVLVDPGTNAKLLLAALAKEKVAPLDLDLVFLSHYHPDHFLNLSVLPQLDLYDGTLIWSKDRELNYSEKIPGTNIQLLPTPGHAPEHTSLLVETDDMGTVCVAQDVFWWEDGKQKDRTYFDLLNLEDQFATDLPALKQSREKVLEIADWIIPGHGKMFKNPRSK